MPAKSADKRRDRRIYIAGRTEEDVYATLDLPWIPPEMREDRWEFAMGRGRQTAEAGRTGRYRGDLHMHTDATDGKATLEEMVAAAQARGLKYIAITDHSKRVTHGQRHDRRLGCAGNGSKSTSSTRGCAASRCSRASKSTSSNEAGSISTTMCLSEADWVVASVHYGQNQPREQITKRIVDALANPNVCAIAHPTGRIINRRKPYEVDLEAVYEAAKKHRKFMELNSNPARLDLERHPLCRLPRARHSHRHLDRRP